MHTSACRSSIDGSFIPAVEYRTDVPAGALTIEVVKGFEYEPAKVTVQVTEGRTTTAKVELRRAINLKARGWYSGSNHVHMNYAGNLHNTPENLFLMAAAEDADVMALQIANKDNRILDQWLFVPGQAEHPLSTRQRIMHVGQEYRPPFYGHISLFNLQKHLISPFVTGYEGTGVESLYPSNTDIFRYAKEQGGIGAYVHPFSGARDPLETTLGTAKSFPVDVALGALSYHELWSQSAGDAPLMVWYRVLNAGFRVPVVGGEDSISNLHDIELVASVRGYFHLGSQPLTWANWMKAFLAGRGFVSNGPLIEFTANGRMPGEELAVAPGARVQITAEVTVNRPARSRRSRPQRRGDPHRNAVAGSPPRQHRSPGDGRDERLVLGSCHRSGSDVPGREHATAGGDEPGLCHRRRPADSRSRVSRVLRQVDRSTDGDGHRASGLAQRSREGARARSVRRGASDLPAARRRSAEMIAVSA